MIKKSSRDVLLSGAEAIACRGANGSFESVLRQQSGRIIRRCIRISGIIARLSIEAGEIYGFGDWQVKSRFNLMTQEPAPSASAHPVAPAYQSSALPSKLAWSGRQVTSKAWHCPDCQQVLADLTGKEVEPVIWKYFKIQRPKYWFMIGMQRMSVLQNEA